MVKAPLVNTIPDEQFGTELLRLLAANGFPVSVAFWLKDEDRWELVLGTPLYKKLGGQKAYLKLISVLSKDGPIALSEYPIRLESEADPIVASFLKVRHIHRFSGSIGGRWVEDLLLYPKSALTA